MTNGGGILTLARAPGQGSLAAQHSTDYMPGPFANPDLTQFPPRSPRVRLGGYVILPRCLDKCRASLAGKNGEFHGTSAEEVLSGKYPLSRYLYVYYNAAPNKPVDPLVREFLRFATSREGQEIVVKDGYMPIPAKVAGEEHAKLN